MTNFSFGCIFLLENLSSQISHSRIDEDCLMKVSKKCDLNKPVSLFRKSGLRHQQ